MQISMPEFQSMIESSSLDLQRVESFIKENPYTGFLIISDTNTFPLYGQQLERKLPASAPRHCFIFPAGEKAKNLETAARCWQEMHDNGLDRKTLILAMGGGVVTDLAGFIASCYMRGVDLINIPTTLLGMVDAAIGGKCGVNLPAGKNLVGSFFHPKRIFIVTEFLESLPHREFNAGIAEVIKYGVIKDPELLTYLEQNHEEICRQEKTKLQKIIYESCQIKAEIVQKDPKEKGERAILNYGHTFGHAIESATQYKKYLHGEAVAIGMCLAAKFAKYMKLVDAEFVQRQKKLCQLYNLPTERPSSLSIDTLLDLMKGDKKNESGKINLILPEKIGKVLKVLAIDRTILKKGLSSE